MWVTEEGSNLSKFLSRLITSRSPLSEEVLKISTGTFSGGAVAHRFDDVVTKHESRPNTRVNFFTHVYISSDQMGIFSKGLENYTIHFQGLFLLGLYMIQYRLLNEIDTQKERQVFNQHIKCRTCCKHLTETFFENYEQPPKITPLINCKLLYSTIPDIGKRMFWKQTDSIRLVSSIECKDPEDPRRAMAAGWLMLSSISRSDSPLVHTPLRKLEQSKTPSILSVGSCLLIGIKNIIYQTTKIWLIENIDQLIKDQDQIRTDLFIVARGMLIKSSSIHWAGLRDLMLYPEIRDEFLQETGIFPASRSNKSSFTL